MCGIAGILSSGAADPALVARMTTSLRHRGPDDEGIWTDAEAGISLGHRRLAVIDLSAAGHQPMVSPSGRYVLSYNGEIYNHRALRAELEAEGAREWRGHSDTETLIEAIAAWGLKRTLGECVGMFALALWDREARMLSLARDRFGEKPLYYGWVGGDFVFASELKAIRAHPEFDCGDRPWRARPVRRARLRSGAALDLPRHLQARSRRRSSPSPGTGDAGRASIGPIAKRWSRPRRPASPTRAGAIEALEAALAAAISDQSVADVPVGAFLSGGINSSTIVALWRAGTRVPLHTYSIGFEEAGFDEATLCPRGRPPFRHRPSRTLCDLGRSAGGDPPPPLHL